MHVRWTAPSETRYHLCVNKQRSIPPIDLAARELREIALRTPVGEFLGSEDELVQRLGVAKVTIRQAARLLERDGVLQVKRGKGGGYFASRPSSDMVEAVVCAYLDTMGIEAKRTGSVATALWIECLRQAATADRSTSRDLAKRLSDMVVAIPADAPMEVIGRAEREIREAIFDLIDGGYIRIIFQINAAFTRSHMREPDERPSGEALQTFVRRWKMAKLMQFEAIASGDSLQAMAAALQDRNVWISWANEEWRATAKEEQTV